MKVFAGLVGYLILSAGGEKGAVLTGTVRADSTKRPITGVEVVLEGTNHHTSTDSAGRFVLGGLPAGNRVALFRAIGWKPVRLTVHLVDGDTAQVEVSMVAEGVQLAPITVTESPKAPRGGGVEAFEERRRMGFGKFLDSTELHRNEVRHFGDMMRAIPGIEVMTPPPCAINRLRDCAINRNMLVATNGRDRWGGAGRCVLQVVLDGIVVSKGGARKWDDAFDLNTFRPDELQAVEVYRSPGEIPAEFNSTDAACGVLVLWTRR